MGLPSKGDLRLLLASVVVSLVAGEFLLRAATGPPSRSTTNLLMLTPSYYQVDDAGAIRHRANETLRIVTIFDQHVEFDTTLPSNDLGFIDSENYTRQSGEPMASERYALVGDSFTEGFGVGPWVPRLRDRLRASGRDVEIYNLGVAGAGFQQFERLLDSVSDELTFTHVVILAISNDFYRPLWTPVFAEDGLRLCRGEGASACPQRQPIALIGIDDSDAQILERAHGMTAKLAADDTEDADPGWRRLARRSRLLTEGWRAPRRIYQRLRPEAKTHDPGDMEDPRELDANLKALAAIRSRLRGASLQVVHLPEKEEVATGRYKLDAEALVEELGIPYVAALNRCQWSMSMFFPRDGHPNKTGYENIANCLATHVFG
jgi:lysophospholipase L1-like esterase